MRRKGRDGLNTARNILVGRQGRVNKQIRTMAASQALRILPAVHRFIWVLYTPEYIYIIPTHVIYFRPYAHPCLYYTLVLILYAK